MLVSSIVKNLLNRKDFNILLNKCLENYGIVRLQFIALKEYVPDLTEDFFVFYPCENIQSWFNIYKKELSERKIDVFLGDDPYSIIFKRKYLSNIFDENCCIVFDDALSILSARINLIFDENLCDGSLNGTFEETLIPATKMVLGSYNPLLALTGICRLNCRKNAKRFAKFCKDTEKANRIDFDRKFSLTYSFLREEWRNCYKNMF